MKRNYVVICKRGRLPVTVEDSVVQMRGERPAVCQAAWFKLMGQNSLGEDVDKKLPTRKFLMDEINSRYESEKDSVYIKFIDSISFTLISLED